MINKFRFFIVVVLLFAVSLVGSFNVNGLTKSISGILAKEVISYDGGVSLYHKTYSDGVVFCTTFYVQGVGTSCSLSNNQWSTAGASGVAAIIEKYNAKPSTRNYYYAELAINKFLFDYETKDSVNDVYMLSGMKEFYNTAVNAYNDAKKVFNITLSADKLEFKLSDDNYVSNKISVSGSDSFNIEVSGPSGTTYEKDGNAFYVKVPDASIDYGNTVNVSAVVKINRTISIAKQYDCGSGNQKSTINQVDKVSNESSKTVSGIITKEKRITKLRVSKQDITTKKELSGATLVLKNAKGEEVARWISSDTPYYVEGLDAGEYTLTELIAPVGYKLSEETIKFNLSADNSVTEVVMYNALKDKYKVKISKQDITTKKELSGATLVLKNAKGEEVARWVSEGTPHYLELDAGEYTLVEIQAPAGYDLSYEVIKFSVGDAGEVETEVVMYNSKTPDTSDRNMVFIITMFIIGTLGSTISIYKLKFKR